MILKDLYLNLYRREKRKRKRNLRVTKRTIKKRRRENDLKFRSSSYENLLFISCNTAFKISRFDIFRIQSQRGSTLAMNAACTMFASALHTVYPHGTPQTSHAKYLSVPREVMGFNYYCRDLK
jgi:hypothetical protein